MAKNKTYSQIIDRVASVVRDTTATTAALIEDYLEEVLEELTADVRFPELITELDITTGLAAGTDQTTDFSGTDNFRTYNVIDIRDPDGIGGIVNLIPANILDGAKVDQSNASGYAKFAVPMSDTVFNMWPYGNSTVWNVKYYKEVTDFTATSQTLPLPNLAAGYVADEVTARILEWKDDDRSFSYKANASNKKRLLKRRQNNEYMDLRMQPDSVNFTNADWNRIFGDC